MDATVLREVPASGDHKGHVDATSGKSPEWWPQWSGETVALIASGPTAKKANVAALKGRTKIIAINESYQLCPWADALYACDADWWKLKHGVPEFHGLKISRASDAKDSPAYRLDYADVKKIKVERYGDKLELHDIGKIGSGGNGGFQALNLAVQFGATKIMLIGYDMRVDLGEHWHKRHQMPLSNPHPNDNLPRWRAAIDGAAKTLHAFDIEVVNCSSVSLLKAYPKMTVEEALHAFEL
jgi:hypothetical protein